MRVLCLIAIVCTLAACADLRLTIPLSAQVDRIVVKSYFSPARETHPQMTITERERIKNLVAFLAERNNHWQRPLIDPPMGQFSAALESENKTLLVIWLSPTFIGGYNEDEYASAYRFRLIDDDEWRTVAIILGLPPATKL